MAQSDEVRHKLTEPMHGDGEDIPIDRGTDPFAGNIPTPRFSGEIAEVSNSDGTTSPVRLENGRMQYTDEKGLQLVTGHDISPGTEEQWGLKKTVEHNRSLAHDLAIASKDDVETVGDLERQQKAGGEGLEDEIAEYRKRVKRDEHWVRILYSNPMSDAFKSAYPEEKLETVFDVINIEYNLEQIEDFLARKKEEYAGYEEDGAKLSPAEVLQRLENVVDGRGIEGHPEIDERIVQRKAELDANEETSTMADYRNLYLDCYRQDRQGIEDEVRKYRLILSEISSGRASDPDYKPSETPSSPNETDGRTRDLIDEEGREDRPTG